MKKVLIITSKGSRSISWDDRSRYISAFTQKLSADLTEIEVKFSTYTDICAVITSDKVEFSDTKHNLSLSSYDFIQFKNWHGNLEFASVIARYCQDNGIQFANREVAIDLNIGKLSQAYVFSHAELPVPDTLYMLRERLETVSEGDLKSYGFELPLIMKQVDGSKGDNNHLCTTLDQIHEIAKKDADQPTILQPQYVLQKFIPNDGDLRVLFIGTSDPPFVFLRKSTNGSHLNNTSQGGSGDLKDNDSLPKIYLEHAKKAAEAVKCEIAGVDIIIDKTSGQHYVLEVNSTPAIATGFMVDQKTVKFGDFIREVTEEDTKS